MAKMSFQIARTIRELHGIVSIQHVCSMLGISRQAYYGLLNTDTYPLGERKEKQTFYQNLLQTKKDTK